MCRSLTMLTLTLPLAVLLASPARPADTAAKSDHAITPRRPADDAELRSWLENMIWHHRFNRRQIAAATGLSPQAIDQAVRRWQIDDEHRPRRDKDAPLTLLPYPGGRHPRIGFLDGAVDPQRETKFSVFTPWDESSYVVVDLPEAIWWTRDGQRELLYLAHTHIDTVWTRQKIQLKPLEWQRKQDGTLHIERRLPNGVSFGAAATPRTDSVRMELWITNGTDATLRGLSTQNCVMLAAAKGFAEQTNDNKVLREPYVACRDASGKRWIITAWQGCQRAWANAPCPCMHSDPAFADLAPDKTARLRGWLSFYEGDDLDGELKRIAASGWESEEKKTP